MDGSIFFSADTNGNVLIVSLLRSVGSIAEDDARDEWSDLLEQADDEGIQHVLLDFSALQYFGSVMLEWMVSLWKKLRARKGKLIICNVSSVGREILHTAKFDTLWGIYESRDEAFESLKDAA
ncbi:MAG: anti-anti-sigma factor [Pirellulaceae bacterium]|jgi:anti-anti-sigma factor